MTSEGGFGLNFETQVRLIVDPLSTCISLPPNTSVLGTEKKQNKSVVQATGATSAVKSWNFVVGTGPSYQNESSDSVSRKLLDEFENAFNTK